MALPVCASDVCAISASHSDRENMMHSTICAYENTVAAAHTVINILTIQYIVV